MLDAADAVESHPGARAAPGTGGVELRELLGMSGRPGWIFLALLEFTIVTYLVHLFDVVPVAQAALTLGSVAGCGLLLLVPKDPLPWPLTGMVMLTGPLVIALTSVNVIPDEMPEPWAAFAMSYVLAVLVVRGRLTAAWLSVLLTGTALAVFTPAEHRGTTLLVAVLSLVTVAGVSVCAFLLRPTQQSLRLLRDDAAMRAAAAATMRAEQAERARQLSRLDRVARPMLQRIAEGAVLTAAEREQCRLLEAELRDGLRAPRLATGQLGSAARGARARGVEVLLLDDGGFAGVSPLVRARVLDVAARELDAANGGSVTVRVLPAGRRDVATVLTAGPDGDRRVEISTDGVVTIST